MKKTIERGREKTTKHLTTVYREEETAVRLFFEPGLK